MLFARNEAIRETLFPLLDRLKDPQSIILSDFPDPDSIVSAVLLRLILETRGFQCSVYYSTPISHQETLAMIKILELDRYLERLEKNQAPKSNVWLVDGHGTENFPLLQAGAHIAGIIDHHPLSVELEADFRDICPEAGAAASILYSYLLDLFPELLETEDFPQQLHTGVLYAMRSDTRRGVGLLEYDYRVASCLATRIDQNLLTVIESQTYSLDTLVCFGEAIRNMRVIGTDFLLSDARMVKAGNRDAIPQAAELLLKTDGINTVIVYGILVDNDKKPLQISGSLRTISDKVDVNYYLNQIFGVDPRTAKPYGGGRNYMGGFTIPIEGYFSTVGNDAGLEKLLEFTRLKIREDVEKFVAGSP